MPSRCDRLFLIFLTASASGGGAKMELEQILFEFNTYASTVNKTAEKKFVHQGFLQVFVHATSQRTRSVNLVIALFISHLITS